MHTINPQTVYLIYAGGTFGSYGTPLSPLSADIFLPILKDTLNTHLDSTQEILDNAIIKDSSTLTPSDFVQFYELIFTAYQKGAKRFVLITGTDSLSFLAAFLANAFGGYTDLSLVVTGSMQPLLIANHPDLQLNHDSDAWQNLSLALHSAITQQGVMVAFYQQTFWANNTQKIHSDKPNAFVGTPTSQPRPNTTKYQGTLADIKQRAFSANIKALHLLPSQPEQIAQDLYALSQKETTAVILIGFGAGNFAQTDGIVHALEILHQKNVALVCTTMCPFGGVNREYAAGSWQYQHHVWSGGELGIAGIYGKLLWLHLTNQLDLSYWENH